MKCNLFLFLLLLLGAAEGFGSIGRAIRRTKSAVSKTANGVVRTVTKTVSKVTQKAIEAARQAAEIAAREAIERAVTGVTRVFEEAIDGATDVFNDLESGVWDELKENFDQGFGIILDDFEGFVQEGIKLAAEVASEVEESMDQVADAIEDAADDIKDVAVDAYTTAKDIIEAILDCFENVWLCIPEVKYAKDTAEAKFDDLKGVVEDIAETTIETAKDVSSLAGEYFEEIAESLFEPGCDELPLPDLGPIQDILDVIPGIPNVNIPSTTGICKPTADMINSDKLNKIGDELLMMANDYFDALKILAARRRLSGAPEIADDVCVLVALSANAGKKFKVPFWSPRIQAVVCLGIAKFSVVPIRFDFDEENPNVDVTAEIIPFRGGWSEAIGVDLPVGESVQTWGFMFGGLNAQFAISASRLVVLPGIGGGSSFLWSAFDESRGNRVGGDIGAAFAANVRLFDWKTTGEFNSILMHQDVGAGKPNLEFFEVGLFVTFPFDENRRLADKYSRLEIPKVSMSQAFGTLNLVPNKYDTPIFIKMQSPSQRGEAMCLDADTNKNLRFVTCHDQFGDTSKWYYRNGNFVSARHPASCVTATGPTDIVLQECSDDENPAQTWSIDSSSFFQSRAFPNLCATPRSWYTFNIFGRTIDAVWTSMNTCDLNRQDQKYFWQTDSFMLHLPNGHTSGDEGFECLEYDTEDSDHRLFQTNCYGSASFRDSLQFSLSSSGMFRTGNRAIERNVGTDQAVVYKPSGSPGQRFPLNAQGFLQQQGEDYCIAWDNARSDRLWFASCKGALSKLILGTKAKQVENRGHGADKCLKVDIDGMYMDTCEDTDPGWKFVNGEFKTSQADGDLCTWTNFVDIQVKNCSTMLSDAEEYIWSYDPATFSITVTQKSTGHKKCINSGFRECTSLGDPLGNAVVLDECYEGDPFQQFGGRGELTTSRAEQLFFSSVPNKVFSQQWGSKYVLRLTEDNKLGLSEHIKNETAFFTMDSKGRIKSQGDLTRCLSANSGGEVEFSPCVEDDPSQTWTYTTSSGIVSNQDAAGVIRCLKAPTHPQGTLSTDVCDSGNVAMQFGPWWRPLKIEQLNIPSNIVAESKSYSYQGTYGDNYCLIDKSLDTQLEFQTEGNSFCEWGHDEGGQSRFNFFITPEGKVINAFSGKCLTAEYPGKATFQKCDESSNSQMWWYDSETLQFHYKATDQATGNMTTYCLDSHGPIPSAVPWSRVEWFLTPDCTPRDWVEYIV